MKEVITDSGRYIRIYDDVLNLEMRQRVLQFAMKSQFIIGWSDSTIDDSMRYKNLHSVWSTEDNEKLGFIDRLMKSEVGHEFVGHRIEKCILNLSTASDINFWHAHPEDKVVLYYVNLEWNDGWHGETLFYDESLKNIELATPYTPGRITVFDAKIPHSIRPQSGLATQYRFTLATILVKE